MIESVVDDINAVQDFMTYLSDLINDGSVKSITAQILLDDGDIMSVYTTNLKFHEIIGIIELGKQIVSKEMDYEVFSDGFDEFDDYDDDYDS